MAHTTNNTSLSFCGSAQIGPRKTKAAPTVPQKSSIDMPPRYSARRTQPRPPPASASNSQRRGSTQPGTPSASAAARVPRPGPSVRPSSSASRPNVPSPRPLSSGRPSPTPRTPTAPTPSPLSSRRASPAPYSPQSPRAPVSPVPRQSASPLGRPPVPRPSPAAGDRSNRGKAPDYGPQQPPARRSASPIAGPSTAGERHHRQRTPLQGEAGPSTGRPYQPAVSSPLNPRQSVAATAPPVPRPSPAAAVPQRQQGYQPQYQDQRATYDQQGFQPRYPQQGYQTQQFQQSGEYNEAVMDAIARSQNYQQQPPAPQQLAPPPNRGPLPWNTHLRNLPRGDPTGIAYMDCPPNIQWTAWHMESHRQNIQDARLTDPHNAIAGNIYPEWRLDMLHRYPGLTDMQIRWAWWFQTGNPPPKEYVYRVTGPW